jgi:hypothetical protein
LWFIFIPAPLNFGLGPGEFTYPDGTDILGIKWKNNFLELHLLLSNDTDIDYSNLDIFVRSNLGIAESGMYKGFNQCISGPAETGVAGVTIGFGERENGKLIGVPLFAKTPSVATVYRLRCEKFTARSRIEIVYALVPTPPNTSYKNLRWAIFSAKYEGGYRKRVVFDKRCFVPSCGTEIPDSFNSVHFGN